MRKITGDPLADYPEFADILAPRVVDWRERQLCLCGCGEQTRIQNNGPLRKLPGYLKRGHYNLLYKQAGARLPAVDHASKASAASVAAWDGRTVNSLMLVEEIKEYCRVNGITTSDLAKKAGVSAGWLCDVVRRSRKVRIKKEYMVLLMQAMEKPVHPSLLGGRIERDCIWCGKTFLGHKHARTCSSECRHAKWDWEQNGGRSAGDLELAQLYGV